MKPTVGKIVHFYHWGAKAPLAAIVLASSGAWLDLMAFSDAGVAFHSNVEQGPLTGRHWVWPPSENETPSMDAATPGPWGFI